MAMGGENRVDNPTRTFFPQMLQATKLLILDYDITRYHSFDLFRFLLLDHDNFMHCNPSFFPMIQEDDPYKQIRFYMKTARSLNPYSNFTELYDNMKIGDMEDHINQVIDSKLVHFTYTDLYHTLGVFFERNDVRGFILRYKHDPHTTLWDDRVKVYTTDHIFDFAMAIAIIKKYHINAIMISSIDAVAILCELLEKAEYYDPITFMVGNYAYNYDLSSNEQHLPMLRNLNFLHQFEEKRKHEFGLFDPFSFNIEKKE